MNHPEKHIRAGQCADPTQVGAVAARFDLRVLDDAGVSDGRELAARLVPGVAPASAFLAVQHAVGAALFGFFEEDKITGILAAFPLNAAGYEALKEGRFNAVDLDPAMVAREGEAPAAYYGWGFAASTKDAGRAVVKASVQIHRELYWATPTFARAVTPDGVRALTSIGFRSVIWGDPGLLWIPPNTFHPGLSQ